MWIALLAGAIASAPAPLAVPQLRERHHALTGQVIQVHGWLDVCQPLSCVLFAVPGEGYRPPFVSFGASREFDRSVAHAAGKHVVIEARVTDRCWGDVLPNGDLTVCTDRAGALEPIRLVSILPDAPH